MPKPERNLSEEERQRLWLYTGEEDPRRTRSYYANRDVKQSMISKLLFPSLNYPPNAARRVAVSSLVKLLFAGTLLVGVNYAKDKVPAIQRVNETISNNPAIARVLTTATHMFDDKPHTSVVAISGDKGKPEKTIVPKGAETNKEKILKAIDDSSIRQIITDAEEKNPGAEKVITAVNGVEVNKKYGQVSVEDGSSAKYALIYNTGDAFKYLGSITYEETTPLKGSEGALGYVVIDEDGSTISEVASDVESSNQGDDLSNTELSRIKAAKDFVIFNIGSDDAGEISALPFPTTEIDTRYKMEPNEKTLVLGFRVE